MRKNSFKIESIEESLFLTLIDSQDWNSQKAKNENYQKRISEKDLSRKSINVAFCFNLISVKEFFFNNIDVSDLWRQFTSSGH